LTPPKEKEPKKSKTRSASAAKPARKKRTVTYESVTAQGTEPIETNGATTKIGSVEPPAADFPDYETIRVRAYEIFLARGGEHGHDLEDWLAAENEFKSSR